MQEREQAKSRSAKQIRSQLAMAIQALNLPAKVSENAYLEGEYLRKRALVYEGYLTNGARLAVSFFRILSGGWALVALVAIIGLLHQRLGGFQRAPLSVLDGPLHKLPLMEPFVWMCGIFSALMLSREFLIIKGILHRMAPAPSVGGIR